MTVDLIWQGPVGPGRFPEPAFPADPLLYENLCAAGVYLRIKTYENGRIIAYAGQSVSLLSRFDQHLAAMLSFAAPLRDARGDIVFTGDAAARIDAYGNLADATALATADAGRVRFWYALCDDYFHTEHLNLAEGLIQRRIAARLSARSSDVENAKAAPGAMPDDVPDAWANDLSGLDAADCDLLAGLLGDDTMTLDLLGGHAA
tara:strand:- start:11465 stop:12076 length:612 start_codon:yes stop_codon:yes gene_type:complete